MWIFFVWFHFIFIVLFFHIFFSMCVFVCIFYAWFEMDGTWMIALYLALTISNVLSCKCALPFDDCTFHIWHHNTRQNDICISLRHTVFEFDDLDHSTLFCNHRCRAMFDYTIGLLYPICPIYWKRNRIIITMNHNKHENARANQIRWNTVVLKFNS